MIKSFFQAIACVIMFLVLTWSTPAHASLLASSNGYNAPILMNSMDFSAYLKGGKVYTSWTSYAPPGFKYYKVIRSTSNPDPVYPDDSYIKAERDSDASSYIDTNPKSGIAYYRVCSIVKPDRYCSNVVSIEIDEDPKICTKDWNPVCGTNGITYSNACTAGDVKVAYTGECIDGNGLAKLTLSGKVEGTNIHLNWTIDQSSPKGFKIAKSTINKIPTYPVMSGDTYKYLSDANVRFFADDNLKPGKTYHYRVCQYNGSGGCISYSNPVSLTVPLEFQTLENAKSHVVEEVVQGEMNDIKYHEYKGAIDYLKKEKVVQGYVDGTFRPDNTINRAEFIKIIVGSKYSQDYINENSGQNCFSDVQTEWYAYYICLAKYEGVVSGYPDNTFKPGQNISFSEAAKIVAEIYSISTTKGANWYEGYVIALQDNNYIPSTIRTLDKAITRAEMAELIWRIKEQKKDQISSRLIEGDVAMDIGDYAGWKNYSEDGFSFHHPNWYQGMNWGRVTLTEELDFYQNFGVSGYIAIDTYMHVYTKSGSDLNTSVWFKHPFHSSQEMTINGLNVLKRRYRAPRGTIVNGGRATGENENIIIYTYQLPEKVVALHYFNAHGRELRDVEIFEKIAESFKNE
jgi:hypothetical protein